jgi:hypothetical protein
MKARNCCNRFDARQEKQFERVTEEVKVGPFRSGSNVDFGLGTHSAKVSLV